MLCSTFGQNKMTAISEGGIVILHIEHFAIYSLDVLETMQCIAMVHLELTKVTRQCHNCFGPPFLFVEGLLSTGPTPSSFYLLVEMGLPLYLFPAYML